jgi:hypothetical protein
MTNPTDLIRRGDALHIAHEIGHLGAIASIAALPAVTDPQIAMLQAANARLVEALQANVAFSRTLAEALDIDEDDTVFRVRLMPSGKELGVKSWGIVLSEAESLLSELEAK